MNIPLWCCTFENENGVKLGYGAIVQLIAGVKTPKDLSALLLGLKKAGELETAWIILTCHHVCPGNSIKGWKISCLTGDKVTSHDLEKIVSGAVSCCASQCFIGPGVTVGVDPHPDEPCVFDLDFTVLPCKKEFTRLFPAETSPPSISVPRELGGTISPTSTFSLYDVLTSSSSSLAIHVPGQEKIEMSLDVDPNKIPQKLSADSSLKERIKMFQYFQNFRYHFRDQHPPQEKLAGAPIVFTDTSKQEVVVGFHVGLNEKGHCYGNTVNRIIQLLQGGPVPILAVLQNHQVRRLWPNRWSYLLLPFIDSSLVASESNLKFLIEILDVLVEKIVDQHKDRIIALRTGVPREARLASLDLLNALFKQFENCDVTTLNKLLGEIRDEVVQNIEAHMEHIFFYIESVLEGKAENDPKVHFAETVEKYFHCYNMILNFKHESIIKHVLERTDIQTRDIRLLETIAKRFESSVAIQVEWEEIVEKCWSLVECCVAPDFPVELSGARDYLKPIHSTIMEQVENLPPEKALKLIHENKLLHKENFELKQKLKSWSTPQHQHSSQRRPTLQELTDYSKEINPQNMTEIGINLGLQHPDIQAIKLEHPSNITEQFMALFDAWERRGDSSSSPYTWYTFYQVLKKVKEDNVAEKIIKDKDMHTKLNPEE